MPTNTLSRITGLPRPSSPDKRIRNRGLVFALAGTVCLLAPLGVSAGTVSVAPRTVYPDPCYATANNTNGVNPTITSAACSGAWAPTTSSSKPVNVLTSPNGDYVAVPSAALPSSGATLVVFLGGSNSIPSSYTQFIERAAYNGFAAISLQYPDGASNSTIGNVCTTSDTCYTNFRASTTFGTGIYYNSSTSLNPQPIPCTKASVCNAWVPGSSCTAPFPQCTTWDGSYLRIAVQDSVIARIVAALQSLQGSTPSNSQAGWSNYWGQFLTPNSNSPYHGAYPNWQNIIVAGHSQGGGEIAFLAKNLPAGNVAKRVIMFSSPEDNYSPTTDPGYLGCGYNIVGNTNLSGAGWIGATNNNAIQPSAFWGLRSGDVSGASTEGCYGAQAAANWSTLAVPQGNGTVILDDGSCLLYNSNNQNGPKKCPTAPSGSGQHRFVISYPQASSDLYNHDDTAVDYGPLSVNLSQQDPNVAYVWDQLLTGTP